MDKIGGGLVAKVWPPFAGPIPGSWNVHSQCHRSIGCRHFTMATRLSSRPTTRSTLPDTNLSGSSLHTIAAWSIRYRTSTTQPASRVDRFSRQKNRSATLRKCEPKHPMDHSRPGRSRFVKRSLVKSTGPALRRHTWSFAEQVFHSDCDYCTLFITKYF